MQLAAIIRTLGVLFILFSTTLLPPIAVSAWSHDGQTAHFATTFIVSLVIGLLLWWPVHRRQMTIRARDAFAVVALMWTAMSVLSAVPFVLGLHADFPSALFEAVSGYTTTGATAFTGLDQMPPSILLYRGEIQWLGGIGVIVFAVALLPMLGVGGMQLLRAEVPGPFKDDRIQPRIARTAQSLSTVYIALTAACALAYWLAGMSVLDAVAHSFSTLATGGFSTHDASFGFYNSPLIEGIAEVFMLIGAINFSVHFMAWRAFSLRVYARDIETRTFLAIVLVLIAIIAVVLMATGYMGPLEAIRNATFELITVITTTGFAISNFALWPLALPVLIMLSGFIGGMSGSTAGGIKVVRIEILMKQAALHIRQLVHPRSVQQLRIGGRIVPEGVVAAVWAFFFVYVAVFLVLMLALMMDGLDLITSFGAIATCINNVGPGLGTVASNFAQVDSFGKIVCVIAMLLGRLEIFTVLVLLSPSFWRR